MESLDFVSWDRYCWDPEQIDLYGWIEREDSYKDFIVLSVYLSGAWTYITSSAAKDSDIMRILYPDGGDGIPCKRIEYDFDIKNVIKLNDSNNTDKKG